MSKFYDENVPVMAQLKGLEVGESLRFPLSKYLSVTSNVSHYKLVLPMSWRSRVCRAEGFFEVERTE